MNLSQRMYNNNKYYYIIINSVIYHQDKTVNKSGSVGAGIN